MILLVIKTVIGLFLFAVLFASIIVVVKEKEDISNNREIIKLILMSLIGLLLCLI